MAFLKPCLAVLKRLRGFFICGLAHLNEQYDIYGKFLQRNHLCLRFQTCAACCSSAKETGSITGIEMNANVVGKVVEYRGGGGGWLLWGKKAITLVYSYKYFRVLWNLVRQQIIIHIPHLTGKLKIYFLCRIKESLSSANCESICHAAPSTLHQLNPVYHWASSKHHKCCTHHCSLYHPLGWTIWFILISRRNCVIHL